MIKNATFTSVWDGGYEITTDCKVNTETKEVFDIEISVGTENLVNELDYEYITLNGEDYSVSNDSENTQYWYE